MYHLKYTSQSTIFLLCITAVCVFHLPAHCHSHSHSQSHSHSHSQSQAASAAQQVEYQPTWASLDSRPLPTWYDQAKFG
jgi:Alpha-L-fucosidase